MKTLALLLLIAPAVDAACVHMKKFANTDCSGELTEEKKFSTSDAEGSKCAAWGAFSFMDQYCDADGVYKQKMYVGPGCFVGPFKQEFEKDTCQYGVILSCVDQKECSKVSEEPAPSPQASTVTLLKYDTDGCTDDTPKKITFKAGISKGSPCHNVRGFSVKDQYCDIDGKFKQTFYAEPDCKGEGKDQVFDQDHCMFKFKLGSCVRSDLEVNV